MTTQLGESIVEDDPLRKRKYCIPALVFFTICIMVLLPFVIEPFSLLVVVAEFFLAIFLLMAMFAWAKQCKDSSSVDDHSTASTLGNEDISKSPLARNDPPAYMSLNAQAPPAFSSVDDPTVPRQGTVYNVL